MKRLTLAMVAYFENVPDQVRKRKTALWLLVLAATVLLAFGMGRVKFDTSIEGWFEEDDPTIVAFDWLHHEFGSDDHLYVVYQPKDGNVYSEQSLRTLQQLHQELQGRIAALQPGDTSALTRVVKITSLINAPVLEADDGALISRHLVGANVPSSPDELDGIRRTGDTQKSFPLLYFSKDYQYGGILIETDFGAVPAESAAGEMQAFTNLTLEDPASLGRPLQRPKFKPTDMAEYYALMTEVNAVLNKPEYAAHFEYFPVGSAAAAEYNLRMATELGALNAAALVIIMVLLALVFRSLSAVLWPVVIVVLSMIWTVGIAGWLGLPITFFVMVTAMLTMAIGVADTVHVMSAYTTARNEGHEHRAALRHGFRHVIVACLLTTITNIVAMVALNLTPIVPIKIFAFMCCLGVALPFLFSVYLLPLMLDLWAPKRTDPAQRRPLAVRISRLVPDVSRFVGRLLEGVLPVAEKRPVTIIMLFAALFAVCIYGSTQTKVDTDPVGSFPKDSKIKQSVRVVDQHMMGAQSMEIYLDLGEQNAFHDPAVLNAMDRLQQTIERKHSDVVVMATSLVETVKSSYQTLHEGREDKYVIPDTPRAVSQTLFLFNQSNPEDRRKLVSDNYDRARISVRLYNKGSYEYAQAWSSMRAEIGATVKQIQQTYPDATVSITGMLTLMMQGADYLTDSELRSFGAAILLVSAMLLLLFGSLRGGIIALVPNLIPSILAFGALGLLDRPLDVTTMMIAPIIIGIAVDDTVHFITHYRMEVVMDGDLRRALHATITKTGRSILFTALVLGLGFGIMGFASNAGVANLGIFGSLAILVGLLNDLFLLPALILVFKLDFGGRDASRATSQEPGLPAPGPAPEYAFAAKTRSSS